MNENMIAVAALLLDLAAAKDDLETVLASDEIENFAGDGAEDFEGAMSALDAAEGVALKTLDGAIKAEPSEDMRAHLLCLRRAIPTLGAKALRGLAKQYG